MRRFTDPTARLSGPQFFQQDFGAPAQQPAKSKSVPDSHSSPYQRLNQKELEHGLDH
jgi:hypothetical protein